MIDELQVQARLADIEREYTMQRHRAAVEHLAAIHRLERALASRRRALGAALAHNEGAPRPRPLALDRPEHGAR